MGDSRSDHGHADPGAGAADLGELLTKVAGGDAAAFDMVYRLVFAPVCDVAMRVIRDAAYAEEVAQETLLAVWRTAARYDPRRGTATAWVLMQAHRRAVDRVRYEQGHLRRNAHLVNTQTRPYDQVAEIIENRALAEHLRRRLASLTELEEQAIRLTYYEHQPYKEVARILGIPLNTLKSRVHSALIRLREALDEE